MSVHLKVTSLRLSENTEKKHEKSRQQVIQPLFEVRTTWIKSVTLPLRRRSRYAQKICFTTLLLISALTEYILAPSGYKGVGHHKVEQKMARDVLRPPTKHLESGNNES